MGDGLLNAPAAFPHGARAGDNILIPQPAFALYQTLAESKGIAVRRYRLLPAQHWEADCEHMDSLIDER